MICNRLRTVSVYVCPCVNQGGTNHIHYMLRLVILHGEPDIHPGWFRPQISPQIFSRKINPPENPQTFSQTFPKNFSTYFPVKNPLRWQLSNTACFSKLNLFVTWPFGVKVSHTLVPYIPLVPYPSGWPVSWLPELAAAVCVSGVEHVLAVMLWNWCYAVSLAVLSVGVTMLMKV